MSPKEILQQVIDEGMWDGTEPKAYGDYAASWDASKGVVALANSGGWWTINRRELTEIAAVNELQIAKLIDQRDALLAAIDAILIGNCGTLTAGYTGDPLRPETLEIEVELFDGTGQNYGAGKTFMEALGKALLAREEAV